MYVVHNTTVMYWQFTDLSNHGVSQGMTRRWKAHKRLYALGRSVKSRHIRCTRNVPLSLTNKAIIAHTNCNNWRQRTGWVRRRNINIMKCYYIYKWAIIETCSSHCSKPYFSVSKITRNAYETCSR